MADVRWLSEYEQRAWRAFIAAQRLVNTRIESQLQHDSGMPHTYYEILVRLADAPDGRLRMSELAISTLGSRSRLSHAVARLESNGLVRREGVASDRRGQVAILTDEGLAALKAAAPGHVESVREAVFDALTPEQVGQLTDICLALSGRATELAARDDAGRNDLAAAAGADDADAVKGADDSATDGAGEAERAGRGRVEP